MAAPAGGRRPLPSDIPRTPFVPHRAVVKPAHGVVLPEDHPAYPPRGAAVVCVDGDIWMEPSRLITPDLAAEFLEYNPHNRNVVQRAVDSYARDMTEGRWSITGDAFRFADTGRMLDGQHRCWAIIQSGVSVTAPIITGLDEDSQDNMDVGRKRTVGDQLKLSGYAHYNVIGTAARVLWLWERGSLLSGNPAPSNPELLDFVDKLGGGGLTLEAAAVAVVGARKIIRSHSILTACYHKAWTVDQLAAEEFFTKLETGANLSSTSPILALRETAPRRQAAPTASRRGGWSTTAETVYLIARAWMLWRKGQQTSKIIMPKGGITMKSIPDMV